MGDRDDRKVTLRNRGPDAQGERTYLQASVDGDGNLKIFGEDSGPEVEAAHGAEDYEFTRIVDREQVPTVLLALIQETFTSDSQFSDWLESHGIPNKLETWP